LRTLWCRCSRSDIHFPNSTATFSDSTFCFDQVSLVYFKSNKFLDIATLRRDCGITDTEERIQHGFNARRSVQFDAPFGKLNRECRRMRPFLFPALNCFVGNEPGVAATPQIIPGSMRPARNVALILIWNAKCQSIQLYATGFGEMKNIFVAVIEKSR